MEQPLVSIILPTYNRPDLLGLTLKSIDNQIYRNFEIIVVDDGGATDETKILCETFSKVRYYRIINSGGPAKPRNFGIEKSKGEYIAFMDDDDLWHKKKLKIQVEILNENPQFGIVHSPCKVIDNLGHYTNTIIGKPGSLDVKHGDVRMRMVGNWTLMTSSVMIRKNILKKVGMFNSEMPPAGEDMEFWTRCSFYTKFYYIDEPLVQYRRHSGNISGDEEKYIALPLFLKNVIREQLIKQNISNKQYQYLLNNLCKMQIRTIKKNFKKTLANLFILDFFWIARKSNLKMFIYVLFLKRK